MQLYRLTFPSIAGPFTLEHVREAERWTAELLAWSRGERTTLPAGVEQLPETKPPPGRGRRQVFGKVVSDPR